MTTSQRLSALVAYLPVLGWLYVGIFQSKDKFSKFHLRQSLGLFIFLLAVFLGWAVLAALISLFPYAVLISVALFTLVIFAFLFGIVAWLLGIANALRGRMAMLPVFGRFASRI